VDLLKHQGISQEVKAWSQMGLPNGQWPQAYFKLWQNGLSITKSMYWSGHQSPDLNPIKITCGQNWERVCQQGGLHTGLSYTSFVRKNGTKFTQTYCGKLVEGYPNCLTQFKGNATNILIECM
jgi:hypothetical protein